jgi:hypothetical protein
MRWRAGNCRAGLTWLAGLLVAAAVPLAAQCLVGNSGGSQVNINRPGDAGVPAAKFSPLSELNKELPDWLCFTAGYRARFESYSAGNFEAGNSDSYLLTRFRFGMLIKPARWLKLYTELQDATAFWKKPPVGPPYQSTWDLRRAFLDLGDPNKDHIALRVGRQDLGFGYGRLVGTSYWRNVSRGYDAVLAVFNWDGVHVSAFTAAQVVARANGLSHHQQGNNLHGLYGSLGKLVPGSAVEPYLFWRLAPNIKTEEGGLSKLDEKIVGVRWAGSRSRFDYDAEIAGEVGHIGPDRIRAWGWSVIAGYNLEPAGLKTRIFVKYDFASGDRNPKDGLHGTFDQLHPNIHDHHGLADQVSWQNLKCLRSGVRVSLRRNWIVAGAYNSWWLASATDAFYNSSGSAVARDATGRSGTHIGDEYDVETSYRPNREIEFGAGVGYVRSGEFLLRTHHAGSYTYPYVMFVYNFL